MEYIAVQRNARISPRKARLSATLIRGKRVEEALNLLGFELRRGSYMLRKVLESAIANAASVGGIDPMELVVTEARVNGGFIIKRCPPAGARPRPRPPEALQPHPRGGRQGRCRAEAEEEVRPQVDGCARRGEVRT